MLRKILSALASAVVSSSLLAANWSEYTPEANVELEAGEHVVDSLESLAYVNALASITNNPGAYVVFNVPEGEVWRVQSRING